MSVGTIKPVVSAADIEALPDAKLQLQARAALAAGYTVDVRHIRYEFMIFANGKHFYPLSNWGQCVRLIVDTQSKFKVLADGAIYTSSYVAGLGVNSERREPTTDPEYHQQMCDAVVTNVAKGCAF
jgi:hypothetical protein